MQREKEHKRDYIALQKRLYSAKETCREQSHTNRHKNNSDTERDRDSDIDSDR